MRARIRAARTRPAGAARHGRRTRLRSRWWPVIAAKLAGERGAGGVVVLAVGLLVLAISIGAIGMLAAFPARQAAQAAADAGALAAADVASGYLDGEPCAEAGRVVEANGASLEECATDGREAVVRVRVESGPFVFSESSRAGPPPEREDVRRSRQHLEAFRFSQPVHRPARPYNGRRRVATAPTSLRPAGIAVRKHADPSKERLCQAATHWSSSSRRPK
ncbi:MULTISPECIES: Rv3654c family TadE-like protein [unclassified Pseudoclavibacter]|uniref:Rv3654c family TadE-like protein n=1 Tax=unclassified Pseudoclavibacter TaxID=2615177 RepID=UPI000CE7DBD2|nr:hypothetical protein C5E05_10115 [Pseudoclavibacter sp. AY1H1]PPF74551.1 hypothetical protein C5B99_14110 [Pseudoclavibacter sp. Z016]